MVLQGILTENAGDSSAALVVQLGDVGSGPTSGSAEAFEVARDYLEGFDCPYNTILGKHHSYM